MMMMIANGNDDDDDDDDDDYGRDAVGVSHAAPPRLRPPDNGNLGGATYTSCMLYSVYSVYTPCILQRIRRVYTLYFIQCIMYMQRTSCLGGAGWRFPTRS